jgi:hypothetical protein
VHHPHDLGAYDAADEARVVLPVVGMNWPPGWSLVEDRCNAPLL